MQCVKQIKFDTFSVLKNHYILDNNLGFNNNIVGLGLDMYIINIHAVDDDLYCKLNGFYASFFTFRFGEFMLLFINVTFSLLNIHKSSGMLFMVWSLVGRWLCSIVENRKNIL